jgi:hypothetical protein
VSEFCDAYASEIALPFSCLVRANHVTESVVDDLRRAGCYRIMMGVESGSEHLRVEILKRRMSDDEILEAARIVRAAGIRLVTANILALPGGTLADDWATVDLNIRARSSYASASILQSFPGTEIHEIADEMGLLKDDHVAALSDGGFGLTSTLKIDDPGERRRIENLHKFFPMLIWFPWLRPLVRRMIGLPPNRIFNLVYTASVNIGIHFISVPPSVGRTLFFKKFRQRFLPEKKASPQPSGAVAP